MRMLGFRSYGGPDVAELLEVPTPAPGPGQLLIELRAAGVNPADIKVRGGQRTGSVEVRLPMAMGREAAGTVLALGAGVTGFAVGDEVFGATAAGTGAFAEQVLLDAAATALRPAGVTPEQAASIPVSFATAYDALDQWDLPEASTVLVVGAGGGVGTSLCTLARARGLRAIGVASSDKHDLVEGLGAVHVLSGPHWVDRVRAIAPDGVDALLDLVGGVVLEESVVLLAPGRSPTSIAAPDAAAAHGGGGVTRRRTSAVFAEIAELVAAGTATPIVTAAYPLDRAAEAVAAVEAGHAAGNVVVTR